jgi:hypothetical protein
VKRSDPNTNTVVDVFVGPGLPYGILAGYATVDMAGTGMALDAPRVHLKPGITENVPKRYIDSWLRHNKNLACVKRGDVRIIPSGDKFAVDRS